jgi:hypothetical protein
MREIGRARAMLIALGGLATVLGLYWDDAWHTDVGRDTFVSPPHLLLYGGVGLLLLTVASWAWQRFRVGRWSVFGDLTLTLPLLGAGVTLAAAPVDELWHELFGRDAVVWSPPHMVAVAGMLAFAAGLFLAAHAAPDRTSLLAGAVIGAFLISAAGTVVMEFEADVPQFPVMTYLPVHIVSLAFAFALIRRVSDRTWTATCAAGVYVALRIVVVGFLALLGHSLPTVMPTFVSAWTFDVAVQRGWRRSGVASAVAIATALSHVAAHALQPAGLTISGWEIAIGGLVGAVAGTGVLAAVGVGARTQRPPVTRLVGVALLSIVMVSPAAPALAHDPGQGEEVAPIELTTSRDGSRIELELTPRSEGCTDWQPRQIVARRAGRTAAAPLHRADGCVFRGAVAVDDPGRWFVYAEIDIHGEPAEAWIPVEPGLHSKLSVLYPPPPTGTPVGQIAAGVVLYLLVFAILGGVTLTYRRAAGVTEEVSAGAPAVPSAVPRKV